MTPLLSFLYLVIHVSSQTINRASCPPVLNTTTSDPPFLNTPSFELLANNLTINWIWKLTTTRSLIPSTQFGSCPFEYPFVSVVNSSCSLNQSVSSSWATLLSACAWSRLGITPNRDVLYGGNFTLFGSETFVDDRGVLQTRSLSYTFPFEIAFPQVLAVDAQLQVFSPILVSHYIVNQFYTTNSTNGTVNFQTVVEYPWEIVLLGDVIIGDSNQSASVSPDTLNPGTIASAPGTFSVQNFILSITPGDSATIDGNYTIFGTIKCVLVDPAKCPQISQSKNVTFTMSLSSSSFCQQSNNSQTLEGSVSISNTTVGGPQTEFTLDSPAYVDVLAFSPFVTVTNVVIDEVFLTSTTPCFFGPFGTTVSTITLYSDRTWLPSLGAFPVLFPPQGSDQKFRFTLSSNLFAISPPFEVSLVVKANATYLGTFTRRKKRDLMFAVACSRQSFQSTIQMILRSSTNLLTTSFFFVLCTILAMLA